VLRKGAFVEYGYEEADEGEGRMARGTNIAVVWTLDAADGTTMNTKIADLMCVISTSGHYGVKKRKKKTSGHCSLPLNEPWHT
jgi:hypothetical protein